MAESAPLLREYTSKGYRGFESLPVRQLFEGMGNLKLLVDLGSRWFRALLAVSLGWVAGCGTQTPETQEAPVSPVSKVVGRIAQVDVERGFVLIRRHGPGDLPEAGVYSARNLEGNRAVTLQLSGETLGRFYAADFLKDVVPPRPGDLVVFRPTGSAFEEEKSPESQVNQGLQEAENIREH